MHKYKSFLWIVLSNDIALKRMNASTMATFKTKENSAFHHLNVLRWVVYAALIWLCVSTAVQEGKRKQETKG